MKWRLSNRIGKFNLLSQTNESQTEQLCRRGKTQNTSSCQFKSHCPPAPGMELFRQLTNLARWFMEQTKMKTKKKRLALWTRIPGQKCKLRATKTAIRSINRISASMEKKLRIYIKQKRVFLKANPICQVCKRSKSVDVHHKHGRIGDLLLDVTTWLAVCHQDHIMIHNHMHSSLEAGLIGPWGRKL